MQETKWGLRMSEMPDYESFVCSFAWHFKSNAKRMSDHLLLVNLLVCLMVFVLVVVKWVHLNL